MTSETASVPAAAAAVSEIQHETCATCRFFFPNPKGDGKIGACRAGHPSPLVRAFTLQQDISGQQVMVGIVDGYFAPTNHALWCGDYKRKGTNGSSKGFASFALPELPKVGEAEEAH